MAVKFESLEELLDYNNTGGYLPLEDAINAAAQFLPDPGRWTIHVSVEQGAGWVVLEDAENAVDHAIEDDPKDSLANSVVSAIGLANRLTKQNGVS